MTARASGREKSGLSSKVYANVSTGASIASFGEAWKVGSGRKVIDFSPNTTAALVSVSGVKSLVEFGFNGYMNG